MELPTKLFTDYRAGIISRQQFIQQFGEWQKARGIDYDCKGTGERGGLAICYRGQKAKIVGGLITWINCKWRDPATGIQKFKRLEAASVFEFRRAVDFALRNAGGER